MKLFTIGFTKKTAETFFSLLRVNGVQRLIDIRLRPEGQLAGFARQHDLAYFLAQLINCDYYHLPLLTPSQDILADYRRDHDWNSYVRRFEALMDERDVPASLDARLFEDKRCCLLCSEATTEQCHRRLVAERLVQHWPDVEVVHIV